MRIAVVCAMNQNRSMEAHAMLKREGYEVGSYGTNPTIRLPGSTIATPNEYTYSSSYREIHDDLLRKDERLYRENGLLMLMKRNMQIKERPQHFFASEEVFDLVITCEEKCFNAIFDHYVGSRPNTAREKLYLVNFDINDTQQDALTGSEKIVEFVTCLSEHEAHDMGETVSKALLQYTRDNNTQLLFSVVER